MPQLTVELPLPPELYERVAQIAKASNRTVEDVLMAQIGQIFGTSPDDDIEMFTLYTDGQLWGIVHDQLSNEDETQLEMLITLGKQGQLLPHQQDELENLLALVDEKMLRRSEALLILQQRGHNIRDYLKLGV